MESKSNSDSGIHLEDLQGTSAKINENKFRAENEKIQILCFYFFVADENLTKKSRFFSPFPTLAPLPGLRAQPPSLGRFSKYFFSDF